MRAWERLFDIYVPSLLDEGRRFLQLKSLALSVVTLQFMRKIMIMAILNLFATLLATISVFTLVNSVVLPMQPDAILQRQSLILISLVTAGISFAFLWWNMREKRWLQVLRLNQMLSLILHQDKYNKDSVSEIFRTEKTRAKINLTETEINQLIERKLAEIFNRNSTLNGNSATDDDDNVTRLQQTRQGQQYYR